MTPEEKSLLERTYKMAEENNTILRSIRRGNRFSIAMRIIYWTVIIGFSVGAFYLFQPYLDNMLGTIDQAQSVINNMNGTATQAQDMLDGLKLR